MPTALASVGAITLLSLSQQATAWTQPTHKQLVVDAVTYMENHPESTQWNKLKAILDASGISKAVFADVLGQAAYDVDSFEDTYICGAITGDCVRAPVYNALSSLTQYTSFWHFQNHTQGTDAHGNDFGGYNYDKLTVSGTIDSLAATWLVNDHLDDGNGGMTGFCFFWSCSEDSEYNSYGITEANYRQGSYSNKSMYEDYQDIPFQPIDNLGQHWFSQFLAAPTIQTLGFVLHTTDLLQPHHTWTTLDLKHSGWEGWVEDYYDSENLHDEAMIEQAVASFSPLPDSSTDIRPLLTEGGAISYATGGAVLSTTDHSERVQLARDLVPKAIAMAVKVIDQAIKQF